MIEQDIQQIWFATSTNTCYNFDKAILTAINQFFRYRSLFISIVLYYIIANIGNFLRYKNIVFYCIMQVLYQKTANIGIFLTHKTSMVAKLQS